MGVARVVHAVSVEIVHSDCREVLATMEPDSFDAVVTDPPYHLTEIGKWRANGFGGKRSDEIKRFRRGFMGKTWDGGDVAFRPETWAEVYRVLKPGAYLAAFGGDRTYHRLVTAIEDAGFDIRHTVIYLYASGFPKSRNISRDLNDFRCLCSVCDGVAENAAVSGENVLQHEMRGNSEADTSSDPHVRDLRQRLGGQDSLSSGTRQDVLQSMRGEGDLVEASRPNEANREEEAGSTKLPNLRHGVPTATRLGAQDEQGNLLQPVVPGTSAAKGTTRADCETWARCGNTGVSRSRGVQAHGREEPGLEGRGHVSEAARELRASSLCALSAGSSEHGQDGRLCDGASASDGSLDRAGAHASGVRPSCGPQSAEQCAEEPGSLAGQPEPQNGGAWPHCGRCGKPVVPAGLGTALKPACELICIARKPITERNVAANVLRWGTGALNIDASRVGLRKERELNRNGSIGYGGSEPQGTVIDGGAGRWPANVCHDGSPEVLQAFARFGDKNGGHHPATRGRGGLGCNGHAGQADLTEAWSDTGSAARFFFCAKADQSERCDSKHPTVKPVSLMSWLVQMVTPPGGRVLDPFCGTGSTLVACDRLGFDALGIEQDARTVADAHEKIRRFRARRAIGDVAERHEPLPGQQELSL